MTRWTLLILATQVLVAGCGESLPSTPADQGMSYLRTGRYDQAITACDEAIRLDRGDSNAYLIRGRAYQFRNNPGDLERAIADFGESIRIAPDQIEAYYSRAIAYRDQGDAEKSLADNSKARENDDRLKQIYSHMPETVPPVPVAIAEKAADESNDGATTEAAKPPANDELGEGLRLRRRLAELDSEELQAGPSAAGTAKRGIPRKSTRDQRGMSSQFLRPNSDDDATDNGPTYKPLDAYDTPTSRPNNQPKSWNTPPGRQDADQQQRGAQGTRGDSARRMNSSRWNDLDGPLAPGQSRGRMSDLPRLPSPVQSPFPQLPPRPTGFVEEQSPLPGRPQPRQYFNNPYAAPTVHPPGAYHSDFNP